MKKVRKIEDFEEKTGIVFNDRSILDQALTHRSYINENKQTSSNHNERLEFLGDAVLELAITDFLYHKYPETNEGELTSYRAALVNTVSLSKVASDLSLNDFLLMSKGESKDTGRARDHILANAVEAVIGATYLDQGYEKAEEFIKKYIAVYIDNVIENKLWIDSKSLFQEKAQEHAGVTPSYRITKETGPDHDRHFIIGAYIGEKMVGQGEGKSKQEAEQEAAQNALEKNGWE